MEPARKQQQVIFRSKLPDIDIPNHLLLHSYCFQNISQFSYRPCLINSTTNEVHTYAEVELISRKVAAGLNKLGIQQGQIIMLLLNNSPEFVFAFLGVSYCGATIMPVNPFYRPGEISKQAKSSNARLIITQASYVGKVKDLADEIDVKIMCIDSPPEGCLHFSELTQSDENDLPVVEINTDDTVALLYSSGTTGLPKGVMLTHKGFITNVAQQVDGENPNMYFNSNDVLLSVLPMFHVYSLNTNLLCGLRVGAAILIMQKFEIVAMMELVLKYKVTVAPLVPPIAVAITKSTVVHNYDLSSIRMVMCGAAPMGKELEDTLRAILPNAKLAQAYGMTEAGPVLSMCMAFAKEPLDVKAGSCGSVIRNAEMKIVDPETGASLTRNQPGEICIRGPQIMKGYLNNPEATEKTIDNEGWLHTGDVGYIDEDDELFIVDRLKELIKYKGFQVAPAELEDMLITHPKIFDAAVVPMKDDVAGEVPVAFVAKSNGCEITEDEIKEYISKQVVFYKRINRVLFIDAVPRAPSGKIQRRDLRAKLAAGFPN